MDFQQELEQMVLNHAEDISLVRGQGLMIDDDNELALENITDNYKPVEEQTRSWGWDRKCKRKVLRIIDHGAKLHSLSSVVLETVTYIGMFLIFFP